MSLQPIAWPRDCLRRDLKELGIVLGLVACCAVVAPCTGPRMMKCFCESKTDIAKGSLKKFVYEAYPQWSAHHPAQLCPANIDELDEYMNDSAKDPWGRHYEMRCPSNARPGIEVVSFGPDKVRGTDDDLSSDDPE